MHVSTVSAGEEQHSGGSATRLHRCGSTLQPSNPVCFRSMLALCHDLMSVPSFLRNACRATLSSRAQDRQRQRACLWCFGGLSQPAVCILDLQHPSSATCITCEPNPYHAAHCSTCFTQVAGHQQKQQRTQPPSSSQPPVALSVPCQHNSNSSSYWHTSTNRTAAGAAAAAVLEGCGASAAAAHRAVSVTAPHWVAPHLTL